jgi:RNA polymerase sigma factor (sigma-70 family)
VESRLHHINRVERFGRPAYLLKIALLCLLCAKASLLLPPTLHAHDHTPHPCRLDLVSKALRREPKSFLDHPLHHAEALTAAEDSVARRLIKRAEKIQNPSARYLLIEDLVSDARKHLYSIYQEDLNRKHVPSKSNAYINLIATKTVDRISLHRIELEQNVPQLNQLVKKIAVSRVQEVAQAVLPDLVERLFEKTKSDGRSEEDRYRLIDSLSSEIFEYLHAASKTEVERLNTQKLSKKEMDQSRIIKFVSQRILPKLTGDATASTPIVIIGASNLYADLLKPILSSSPRQTLVEQVASVFEKELYAFAGYKQIAIDSEKAREVFLKKYFEPLIPEVIQMIRAFDLAHPHAFEDKKEYEELKKRARTKILTQLDRRERQDIAAQAQSSPGSLALEQNKELFEASSKMILEGINRRTALMSSPQRELTRQQLQLEALQKLQNMDVPPDPLSKLDAREIKTGRITREILSALELTSEEIKFASLRLKEHPQVLEHAQLAISPQRRRVLEENLPKMIAEILERSSYHYQDAQKQKTAEGQYVGNLLRNHPEVDTSVLRHAVTKTTDLKQDEDLTRFQAQERWIEFREAALPALIERTRFERSIYEGWYGVYAYALPHEKVFLNELIEGQSLVKKRMRYDLQKKAEELKISPQEALDRYMPILNRMFTEALDAQLGSGQSYAQPEVRQQAQEKMIAFIRAHPLYQQLLGVKVESLPAARENKISKAEPRMDREELESSSEAKSQDLRYHLYIRSIETIELLTPEQEKALFTKLEELETKLFPQALKEHRKRNSEVKDEDFKSRGSRSQLILRTDWKAIFEDSPSQAQKLDPLVAEYRGLYNHAIQSNLRLAAMLAYKKRYPGVEVDDLIQVGNLGLMKAVSYFEVSKGFKFSTYAYAVINRFIQRNKDLSGRTFGLNKDQIIPYMQIREAEFTLMQQGIFKPSDTEIATQAGLEVDLVRRILERVKYNVSLDAPIDGADDGASFSQLIPDQKQAPNSAHSLTQNDTRRQLMQLLNQMNDAQLKDILIRRNGLDGAPPATLEEIGKGYGIAKERIRQLELVAERHLKVLMIMSVERFTPIEKDFIQTHYLHRQVELDLVKTARLLQMDLASAQKLSDHLEDQFKNATTNLLKD